MKPHLTEHSDVRCLAECDPTPSRTNVARQLRFARLRRFPQLPSRPPLVALGVGFNSDKNKLWSPHGLHNLCPH